MALLEWDKSFELGIQEFDGHHKVLVRLLNEAYDNFTGETNRESIAAVFDNLIDYATYHFVEEEHWMGLNGYGGLQRHREEHDEFSRRVVELQNDFFHAKSHVSIEVLVFLKEWLTDHILKEDADYGRFAAQRRRA